MWRGISTATEPDGPTLGLVGVPGAPVPTPGGVLGPLDGAADGAMRGVWGAADGEAEVGPGVPGTDWLGVVLADVAVPGMPICRRR